MARIEKLFSSDFSFSDSAYIFLSGILDGRYLLYRKILTLFFGGTTGVKDKQQQILSRERIETIAESLVLSIGVPIHDIRKTN